MAEKVQGLRSTNWQVQNRQEDIKKSMGDGVAKEFIYMTHGHELRWGGLTARGNEGYQVEGGKEES